jgi:hypothetical protein
MAAAAMRQRLLVRQSTGGEGGGSGSGIQDGAEVSRGKVYDSMSSSNTRGSTVTSIRKVRVGGGGPPPMEQMTEQLKNLTELKKLGLIDEREYEIRRNQIIDRATGTSLKGNAGSGSVASASASGKKLLSRTVTLKPHLPSKDLIYGGGSEEERKSIEIKHHQQLKRISPTNPLPEIIVPKVKFDLLNKTAPEKRLVSELNVFSPLVSSAPPVPPSVDAKAKDRGDSSDFDAVVKSNDLALVVGSGGDVIVDPQSPKKESAPALPSKSLDVLAPVDFLDETNKARELARSMDDYNLKQMAKKAALDSSDPWLNARPPPDFDGFACEKAIKYTFNASTGEWNTKEIVVKIDPNSFAKGSLRVAYHCLEVCEYKPGMDLDSMTSVNTGLNCVAKIAYFPDEDSQETYFLDVWIQSYLVRKFAESYNSYKPPKEIEFVNAWVMKLVDRDCLCGVEPYIGREYRKHNNNFGYVSDVDRNTPQAFSHFSHVVSDSKLLICDIQGVNDLYTDPQVHSQAGGLYGKGDMGREGINKFFATHRCNALCKLLCLTRSF